MPRFSFQSYDMSFAVAEGECEPARVSAEGGILAPRINVVLGLWLGAPAQMRAQLLFSGLSASLFIPGGARIADSAPSKLLHLADVGNKSSYALDGPLSFAIDYARVEAIERHRNGGDMRFEVKAALNVCALTDRPDQVPRDHPLPTPRWLSPSCIEANFTLSIPQSIWVENILPQLGYGRIVLAEMPPVDPAGFAAFERSYTAIRHAQEQLKRGFFNNAAAHCRVALEPFFELARVGRKPNKVPVLRRRWKKALGAATYEWLDRSLGAIKADTNATHHSTTPRFDYLGAQMLIAVTTVIIGHAARSLTKAEKTSNGSI